MSDDLDSDHLSFPLLRTSNYRWQRTVRRSSTCRTTNRERRQPSLDDWRPCKPLEGGHGLGQQRRWERATVAASRRTPYIPALRGAAYTTFARSGAPGAHWSFKFFACSGGQSVVIATLCITRPPRRGCHSANTN